MKTTSDSNNKYYYAYGRRKTAVATIRLYEGDGSSLVNGKPIAKSIKFTPHHLHLMARPFKILNLENLYFTAKTAGGGISAQVDAIILGISQALLKLDPTFKKTLKDHKLLTRDSREVERKKTGLRKARKSPQYSKR